MQLFTIFMKQGGLNFKDAFIKRHFSNILLYIKNIH